MCVCPQGERGAAGLDGRPGQDGKPGPSGPPGLRVRPQTCKCQNKIKMVSFIYGSAVVCMTFGPLLRRYWALSKATFPLQASWFKSGLFAQTVHSHNYR